MAPFDREGLSTSQESPCPSHRKARQNRAAHPQLLELHLTALSVYREGGDALLHQVWRPLCPCPAAKHPLHCVPVCWREFGLKGVNSSLL